MINSIYRFLRLKRVMSRVIFWFTLFILLTSFLYLLMYLFADRVIIMHFLVTAIVLIVGVLFVTYAFMRLFSPLLRLRRALNKAKNGDYTERLNLDLYKQSPKEIQQLLREFNETVNNFQQREEQLRILSYRDSLTGIANRRAFDDNYKQIWSQSMLAKHPLSIALIDIDRFKELNDTFGHQVGDQCLRMVSQTLEKTIESSGNIVARYGGEEFVMIFPGMNHHEATMIAEQARQQVENIRIPHSISNNEEIFVTVSIGVASTMPIKDKSRDSLIELADQALYEAKSRGRNNIVEKSETHLIVI